MKNLNLIKKMSYDLENGSGMTRKWFGNDSGMTRFSLASLICLCMLTFGVGNVWGTDATFNLWQTAPGSPTTNNSVSFAYSGCVFGASSANAGFNVNGQVVATMPDGATVTQIVVYKTSNSWAAKANLKVYCGNTLKQTITQPSGDVTITLTGTEQTAGSYKFKNEGSGGKVAYVKKIVITYTASACSAPTVGSALTSVSTTTNSITATVPISATGGCNITENGLVYSTSVATPTVGAANCTKVTTTACGGTAANKEVTITGLVCGTTYYVRGYATNSSGTSYTNVKTQATSACPKYTVTLKDNDATITQATAGASITLPSREGCSGYTFAGWTKTWTEEQDEWTTTAPTIISAGSYTPSANENLYPVYTKTESGGTTDYSKTETFENQTAGTTYNSTQTYTAANSNASLAWSMYYGTVSTNAVLTGSKSAQMRWYSSATSNIPNIKTTTAVSGLQTLTFNAAVGNTNIKMKVEKSTDGSNWTVVASNVSMSTSKTEYSYDISGTIGTGYYIRIGVDGTNSTAPSSGNYTFRVDDVKFDYQEGGGSTTSYISVPNCCTSYDITLSGSGSISGAGTFSADAMSACEGATVTLSTSICSGYTVGAWDVYKTGTPATKITVTSNQFTMPAYGVTVALTTTAKVDHFKDAMHNTSGYTGDGYAVEGCNQTVPSLSNTTPASECEGEHYKFIGWVDDAHVDSDGTLLTGYSIVSGGTTSWNATGTTYYAIWAKEL